MPIRRMPSLAPVSAELQRILLEGPWAIGKTLHDVNHDELRAAWHMYGAALEAALPKGQRAWFRDRDMFVRLMCGEP
jgi:hypothetical protein